MAGIVSSGYLIASDETASFGPGVYVADAVDEAQRGAGCPPNVVDVVTRFQLPRPGALQVDYISGFVEIEVKRQNYAVVQGPYINTVGQPEFVVRSPVVPIVHSGRPAFALLFVPDFVGLHDVCF